MASENRMPPFLPMIKWIKLEENFKPLEFQDDLHFATVLSVYSDYNTSKCHKVSTETMQWEVFRWPDQKRLHNDGKNLSKP